MSIDYILLFLSLVLTVIICYFWYNIIDKNSKNIVSYNKKQAIKILVAGFIIIWFFVYRIFLSI